MGYWVVAPMVRVASRWALLSAVGVGLLVLAVQEAGAIPTFARQTGLRCNVCHTAFPELTPAGRDFKLNGYVKEGSHPVPWYEHFAGMLVPTFTLTQKDQAEAPAPDFNDNDNTALQEASLFYGGKLWDKLGVFAQLTYDGIEHTSAWDNVDLRFADTTLLGTMPLTYGVTLNNNPTVQDVWNTVPAWSFPFMSSDLAPTPAAATLVDETLGQQVAGLGGYALVNRWLYLELAGYRTLSDETQRFFGVDPEDEDKVDGTAPYWRVALQHNWDLHSLEVGAFGLSADTFPGGDRSAGTDRRTDVALDAQYQYLGDLHGVSLQSSWIHEHQRWDASQPLGNAAQATATLRSFKARAAYTYDKTYRANLGYFASNGDPDPGLYPDSRTASPDSNGWILQLDYMPWHKNGGPAAWPWLNVQFTLQYTHYDKFDGARHNFDGQGRDAADNDTLFLAAWAAF